MEMNLKITVFIKVGTDGEIGEKDADVSSGHFQLFSTMYPYFCALGKKQTFLKIG